MAGITSTGWIAEPRRGRLRSVRDDSGRRSARGPAFGSGRRATLSPALLRRRAARGDLAADVLDGVAAAEVSDRSGGVPGIDPPRAAGADRRDRDARGRERA